MSCAVMRMSGTSKHSSSSTCFLLVVMISQDQCAELLRRRRFQMTDDDEQLRIKHSIHSTVQAAHLHFFVIHSAGVIDP